MFVLTDATHRRNLFADVPFGGPGVLGLFLNIYLDSRWLPVSCVIHIRMKSSFAIFAANVTAIIICLFVAVEFAPAQKPLSEDPPAVKAAQSRRVLTMRDRVKFGATIPNVRRVLEKLTSDGEIDDESSHSEIAAAVVARLEKENQKAFGEAAKADRDWASFLEAIASFVEKILPLILPLLKG